jgi:cysteine desulfurase
MYFDNNGTTLICKPAKEAFSKWASCYNPSSIAGCREKDALEAATRDIHKHCGTDDKTHQIIYTSGGSESNCLVIRSLVESQKKPHIVLSEIEHHASISCAQHLADKGFCTVTFVKPNKYGTILLDEVKKAVKPNTALISIMYANNELGTINKINKMSAWAYSRGIMFHTDAVQIFGKVPLRIAKNKIGAVSVAAHKFYGPKGIGFLVLERRLIKKYGLSSIVHGSQNQGMRGGTENVPGIIATAEALKWNFTNRGEKNKRLCQIKSLFMSSLRKEWPELPQTAGAKEIGKGVSITFLGEPRPTNVLCNTVMFAFLAPKFCNVQLKKDLHDMKIDVSVSSACLTSSKNASHVMEAIGVSKYVKRGVLRISFGDYNSKKEIPILISALRKAVSKQIKHHSV